MSVKQFLKLASLAFFLAVTVPVKSVAAVNVTLSDSAVDARMFSSIVNRVAEIESMDKTELSNSDKRALRKELKEMKKNADGLDSRVYISIGAVIIIILLLVLILR